MCKAKDEANTKLDVLIQTMDRLTSALLSIDGRVATAILLPRHPSSESAHHAEDIVMP